MNSKPRKSILRSFRPEGLEARSLLTTGISSGLNLVMMLGDVSRSEAIQGVEVAASISPGGSITFAFGAEAAGNYLLKVRHLGDGLTLEATGPSGSASIDPGPGRAIFDHRPPIAGERIPDHGVERRRSARLRRLGTSPRVGRRPVGRDRVDTGLRNGTGPVDRNFGTGDAFGPGFRLAVPLDRLGGWGAGRRAVDGRDEHAGRSIRPGPSDHDGRTRLARWRVGPGGGRERAINRGLEGAHSGRRSRRGSVLTLGERLARARGSGRRPPGSGRTRDFGLAGPPGPTPILDAVRIGPVGGPREKPGGQPGHRRRFEGDRRIRIRRGAGLLTRSDRLGCCHRLDRSTLRDRPGTAGSSACLAGNVDALHALPENLVSRVSIRRITDLRFLGTAVASQRNS